MSSIASILEQTPGKIRFRVDNVETASEKLPVQALKSQLETSFQTSLLAFSHDDEFQLIQSQKFHPLALAVHLAFSEHRPLLLTPDMIWITITQGLAQHVNNHAETLRSHFVRHQGQQILTVESDIPSQPQHWMEIIQEWTLHLRDHGEADLYRLLECNFSTTTPMIRIASHVVMMDAFQQYFDYVVLCVCGIPDITLLGTVEDWQSIYQRVKSLARYDLNWWTDRLLPICQELVDTASGKPSLEFWQCIYKPETVYAAEYITGWLADLFPYLKHPVTKAPTVRNPLLEMDHCHLPIIDQASVNFFQPVHDGITLDSLPLGLSQVPLTLKAKRREGQEVYKLELVAGFLGVYQDAQKGVLHPEIGWFVKEKGDRLVELLDEIQQQHLTHPPMNWAEFRCLDVLSKEHIQLLERFDGATLYANSGHGWQIVKQESCQIYEIAEPHPFGFDVSATHLMNLDDGRCIGYVYNFRSRKCWIILGNLAPDTDPCFSNLRFRWENVVIIAESIMQLFEQIFQAEGKYYFDQPNFTKELG